MKPGKHGARQMNVVKSLIARIEARRNETKTPCKSYATEAKAEAVAEDLAVEFADYFAALNATDIRPCCYIVAYNEAWGRWVVGFDFTELFSRKSFSGGYIGVASDKGFYTY
jgi:hypothetical protein